jgi:hypothetical protein
MREGLIVVCASLAVLLAVVPVSSAASKDSVDIARQARVECAAGNYEVGARLLAELWVSTKDTTWIYNQARCYEQNGQNELAANRFREYLRVDKSIADDEVKAIELRIRDLLPGLAAAPSSVATPRALPNPAPESTVAPSEGRLHELSQSSKPSPLIQVTATSPPTPAPPFYRRWWFWSSTVAVVVGGTTLAILLASRESPRSPGCDVGVLCGSKN